MRTARVAALAVIDDPAGFVASHIITQGFGVPSPASPSGVHTGLDFAMARGTPIPVLHGGRVTFAARSADGRSGNVVIVRTASGDEWWHAHLNAFAVRVGETVSPGDVIGYAGATGVATGPHLHLEWRDPAGTPIDPYEEVVMLTQETQELIRQIVREEVARSGASIERKIDSGFNLTMPVMLRRLARWVKLGLPRDPAGDPRTSPPAPYSDDSAPLG